MKTLVRVILIVLFIILALPLVPAGAQESSPITLLLYQRASSGSLTDQGDGTYSLTMTDVSDTLFLQSAPMDFNRFSTPLIVNGWTHVENVQPVEARLETGSYGLSLQLSGPSYDEATASVSYVAQVTAVTNSDPNVNPDKIEIPNTFDLADLLIQMNNDLYTGIEQNLFNGVRYNSSCNYDPVYVANVNMLQTCQTYSYSSPECTAATANYTAEHDKWLTCTGYGGGCCKY